MTQVFLAPELFDECFQNKGEPPTEKWLPDYLPDRWQNPCEYSQLVLTVSVPDLDSHTPSKRYRQWQTTSLEIGLKAGQKP